MAQNRKIHVFRWISQLWSITEAKPVKAKATTKWHGTVVHLHVEKLQPRGHIHWTYRVPAAVSQSREFRPKNRFFSQINSESSKTHSKSL